MNPVWGMGGKQLTACLKFSIFNRLQRIQTVYPGISKQIKVYLGISEQIKPLQLVCQAAEFKFESKFEPLLVIWQSLPKVILWELNSIFYLGILEQIKLARLDWIKNVKF